MPAVGHSSVGASAAAFSCGDGYDDDLSPHVYRGPLGYEEFLYGTGDGRGQLGIDLVGVDLGEGLVYRHLVPFGLEPVCNGALRHALAELRHLYRSGHGSLLLWLYRTGGDKGWHVGRYRVVAVVVLIEA